jgi:hypothetical protein
MSQDMIPHRLNAPGKPTCHGPLIGGDFRVQPDMMHEPFSPMSSIQVPKEIRVILGCVR